MMPTADTRLGKPRYVVPRCILLAACLLLFATRCGAQSPPTADRPITELSAVELAQHIDRRLQARWQSEGITPAARATDAEFLRRVYLDLAGVTPSVSEARAFLDDPSPHKRQERIDQLLNSPRYALHMANTWRDILVPDTDSNTPNSVGLQRWLEQRFADNLPYDAFVAEFLIADRADAAGPGVFYTALDLQPEKLAAKTSQVFLGLQLQCAQCHDHPFDPWSQQDFWGYAAFFARIERKTDAAPRPLERILDRDRGEVMLPDTEWVVAPKLPNGREVSPEEGGTRRQQLSIWMASRDNPYLARAFVNRSWAQFFGRGLVEPVDDMSPGNLPSHPELLDELADYFARNRFDIKQLLRAIANTQAYQLSSRVSEPPPADSFATMHLKTLTPDQLFDSLQVLTAFSEEATLEGQGRMDGRRQEFVNLMKSQARTATAYDRGVTQALMLMNGPLIGTASQPDSGRLLAALQAPFLTDEQRVDTLFLATLCRYPTDDELALMRRHLQASDSKETRRVVLGDMLWAIVNSAEYSMNH